MQYVFLRNSLCSKLTFSFNKNSTGRTRAKNLKFYRSNPSLYKQVALIDKSIDFKSVKVPFKVNLRRRWIYKPDLQEDIHHHNFLNFEQSTGNQILLHLENPQYMRLSETIHALNQLQKRDPQNQYDLANHPWVQASFAHINKNMMHLQEEDVIRMIVLYYRYGVEDPELWQTYESFIHKKFLEPLTPKSFTNLFVLAFKDNGKRFSKEFRDLLISYLPNHLRRMPYKHFGTVVRVLWDHKYMNEYLFDRHIHQLLWKQPYSIICHGGLPDSIDVLIGMNYEHDEYLYPAIYKVLQSRWEDIPVQHIEPLFKALQRMLKAFPSHEQYSVLDTVKKLKERSAWEEGLGSQVKELNLIQIVQTDLLFYKERMKVESQSPN